MQFVLAVTRRTCSKMWKRNRIDKKMKQYRNEWKYCVQETDLAVIENRLAAVMELDSHSGQSGKYEIHSLYFDDYKDTCADDTSGGGITQIEV